MAAYYDDGRGRYGTGESYDWFQKYEDGVTSIVGAFYGCEGLEQITLPNSIVDMTYAFNCCYSLKNIDIPLGAKQFSFAFGGTAIEKMEFLNGAEDISDAFAGCEDLEYVFIPKSVENMTEAFSDCEALTRVVIEEGVTSIGDYTFYNCPKLLELTIPESVVEFGEYSVGYIELNECVGQGRYKVQILPDFKINGVAGSAAEKYAKENGIAFVAI
ncbi:MAG: leucine-rich repeat protein [Lachnospiraceae bacterium]|nr:leucine-rich repeat protein [Lachnospiraceae bacterium]